MSTVKRSERSLLVVSSLAQESDKLKALYGTVAAAAVAMCTPLVACYKDVKFITGKNATVANTMSTLATLSSESGMEAVDLFLFVHGSPSSLSFADGSISSTKIKEKIVAAKVKNLRAMYSTACYASHHLQNFLDAGFKTASGAVGVNANSPHETPWFVAKWALDWTYEKALDPENDLVDKGWDAAAKALGWGDVDSTKKVKGDCSVKINTL